MLGLIERPSGAPFIRSSGVMGGMHGLPFVRLKQFSFHPRSSLRDEGYCFHVGYTCSHVG